MDNSIIKTRPELKVRYTYKQKIWLLCVILFFLIASSAIINMVLNEVSSIYGLIFGAVFIVYAIWIFKKNNLHKTLRAPFRTAFVVKAEGIWFNELNTCIKWTDIKGIVIFIFLEYKHFGFELNDQTEMMNDLKTQELIDLAAPHGRKNMPYICLYDALSPPAKDVIELLRTHYNVSTVDETIHSSE